MTRKKRRPKQDKARVPVAAASKARKGKLSGGIIAMSSAAIVAVYALGRTNSSAVSNQLMVDAPTFAATVAPGAGLTSAPSAVPTVAPSAGPTVAGPGSPSQPTSAPTAAFRDGTYVGTGESRHGGMEVTVVIQAGQITSANVTSCGTRYPCSDVDPLVSEAVSMQSVPVNHVSGSTDSSKAYKKALTSALEQAQA